MDLQLEGRVVMVIGGHGLIGRAVTEQLRAERAIAIPASRRAPDGVVMDAALDESVSAAVNEVIRIHGHIDGLVVAAAPSARTLDPAKNSEPSQVLQAVDAKALTFLRVANAILPTMVGAGYGRVVGVSGQNAFLTGNITGSIRNAALIIAAKSLADSVAGTGVTVNAVSPSIVSESAVRAVEVGSGGQSRPVDIARLISFLVSPLASAISGESIAVGHRARGFTGL